LFASIIYELNLLDKSGHIDFRAEVQCFFGILDGMVGVFDARARVPFHSETVWRQMGEYNAPQTVFTNNMDRIMVHFLGAIESIRTKLGPNAHTLFLNIGA
jgi:elongation factor G